MSPFEDIILKKDVHSIVQKTSGKNDKNGAEDTDKEFKELRRFIKDCQDGQTYALDMLFSTKENWLESSPIWEDLIANRSKLLSSNVKPYIGYCRSQSSKYGLKGDKLKEVKKLLELLGKSKSKFLHETIEETNIVNFLKTAEYIKIDIIPNHRNFPEKFLNVLENKQQLNQKLSEVIPAIDAMKNRYGNRAELAMENDGVDWKAISHSFRIIYQLEELFLTHHIQFPLKCAEKVTNIKLGKLQEAGYKDFGELQDDLYKTMERVIAMETTLPSEPDYEFWDAWLVDVYKKDLLDKHFLRLIEEYKEYNSVIQTYA
jgi:hypothetical protein